MGHFQCHTVPQWAWAPPFFISKLKFPYDEYSVDKVWTKIYCHFYFREITFIDSDYSISLKILLAPYFWQELSKTTPTFRQEAFRNSKSKCMPWAWIKILHIIWPLKLMMVWAPILFNLVIIHIVVILLLHCACLWNCSQLFKFFCAFFAFNAFNGC